MIMQFGHLKPQCLDLAARVDSEFSIELMRFSRRDAAVQHGPVVCCRNQSNDLLGILRSVDDYHRLKVVGRVGESQPHALAARRINDFQQTCAELRANVNRLWGVMMTLPITMLGLGVGELRESVTGRFEADVRNFKRRHMCKEFPLEGGRDLVSLGQAQVVIDGYGQVSM